MSRRRRRLHTPPRPPAARRAVSAGLVGLALHPLRGCPSPGHFSLLSSPLSVTPVPAVSGSSSPPRDDPNGTAGLVLFRCERPTPQAPWPTTRARRCASPRALAPPIYAASARRTCVAPLETRPPHHRRPAIQPRRRPVRRRSGALLFLFIVDSTVRSRPRCCRRRCRALLPTRRSSAPPARKPRSSSPVSLRPLPNAKGPVSSRPLPSPPTGARARAGSPWRVAGHQSPSGRSPTPRSPVSFGPPRCSRPAPPTALEGACRSTTALRSPSGRCPTPRDQSPSGRCPRRRWACARAQEAHGVSQVHSRLLAAPQRRGLQSPLGRRASRVRRGPRAGDRGARRRAVATGPEVLPENAPRSSAPCPACAALGGHRTAHSRPTFVRTPLDHPSGEMERGTLRTAHDVRWPSSVVKQNAPRLAPNAVAR